MISKAGTNSIKLKLVSLHILGCVRERERKRETERERDLEATLSGYCDYDSTRG